MQIRPQVGRGGATVLWRLSLSDAVDRSEILKGFHPKNCRRKISRHFYAVKGKVNASPLTLPFTQQVLLYV